MSKLVKKSIEKLGFGFVNSDIIGNESCLIQDEYFFRNQGNNTKYRSLNEDEIEVLIKQRNWADNWLNIKVTDRFIPELIQDCRFYGMVRIGDLSHSCLSHKNLELAVGLYNSTIISCDFGSNVCVKNVHYLSYYIVEQEVILFNINEMITTSRAKFGNGMVKMGEDLGQRIVIELCNEKGGRAVIPFEGMLPGDAFLWSRFREDIVFQQALVKMTDREFDERPGYYGRIGHGSVIKNSKMIKDVLIGNYAYIKGVNKMKNLTIKSSEMAMTQIGEGCELVNGIVGFGCRIFYGVKAVRFILASHSQLKYGARLINSFLGNNSTVSCCEVLNSLIFPSHEQHHNNSFLCAATLMGQSNMAAGATIGSNHNSRGADGELIAGRGFWPGLCVSLKHNSKFASFVLLTKGSYPHELNIELPFCLVSNDDANNRLVLMPAYWFMHNFYALARNCYKATKRDQRLVKKQMLHYNFLEVDTVSEMVHAIRQMEEWVGSIYCNKNVSRCIQQQEGQRILNKKEDKLTEITLTQTSLENGKRPVVIRKIGLAYDIYKKLIRWNLAKSILEMGDRMDKSFWQNSEEKFARQSTLPTWMNVGGQLILESSILTLKEQVSQGKICAWGDIHRFYQEESEQFMKQKTEHSILAYWMTHDIESTAMETTVSWVLEESIHTEDWMRKEVVSTRKKDYENPFKSMVYQSESEMESVVGRLEDDEFIQMCNHEYYKYREQVIQYLQSLEN